MTDWPATALGLEGVLPETHARLRRIAPVTLPKGRILFSPGDAVQGFLILLSGRVEVFLTGPTGRDILLYAVEPGQSCIQTTLGLMGGEDYSGEAIVHSPCRAVLLPKPVFLSLMDNDPGFRQFVFNAFATRMQSMMHLLERVAFQRVESRLAACLLDRAVDGHLNATHAEIATMIGSAREVVSRRLDALARRGILRLERGVVHLLDPDTLSDIAKD